MSINDTSASFSSGTELRPALMIDPTLLKANEANEKARPTETEEQRQNRIVKMAQSIKAIGQNQPVTITEIYDGEGESHYEYVDGGCRVDAIKYLNDEGRDIKVWCVEIAPEADPFQVAVKLNLDRTQNNVLDTALIIEETIKRNDWSKGANAKAAKYLGMSESRISEYRKVVGADPDVKRRLETGEVGSVEAALELMKIEPMQREAVAVRAAEIAQEEARAEEGAKTSKKVRGSNPRPEVPKTDFSKPNIPKAKTTKSHIEKAVKEVTGAGKWSLQDVREWFEAIDPAAYGAKAVKFADGVIARLNGEGSDKKLRAYFDDLCDGGDKEAKSTTKVKVMPKAATPILHKVKAAGTKKKAPQKSPKKAAKKGSK